MKPKKGRTSESQVVEVVKDVAAETENAENTELTAETAVEAAKTAETVEEEQGESSAAPQPPTNVVKMKSRWWLRYLITAGVLAVFTVLVAWARGVFGEKDQMELLRLVSDAFAVPGILAVCFGLIIVASNGGTFDMLAYGVLSLFRLLKKDPIDRKYGGFYEYRKAKQQNKRSFWYLVLVGGVYLLVGIALAVAYMVKDGN